MRWTTPTLLAMTVAVAPAVAQSPDDLFTASRSGDAREVRRLLDAGVPVDAEDRYGATALLMAASNGHGATVEVLLAAGADPDDAESFYGTTPLAMALYSGHREVALTLLAAGAEGREQALGLALQQGDVALARAAVAAGPLHQSALADLRAREDLSDELRGLLAGATSRPDPPAPDYGAEALGAYEGVFEGWISDLEVRVGRREGGLDLSTNDGLAVPLAAVADNTFRSADGTIEATFFGRAGTIEGLSFVRPGSEPETLRRSVAEPVGAAAVEIAATEAEERAPTVHWPAFRGANAEGIGDGAEAAVSWDVASGEGVLWSTPIEGLGNSSPVVWGDRVFVTTAVAAGIEQTIQTGLTGAGDGVEEAVEHSWQVLAFDKWSGEPLWATQVGRGVPLSRRHFKGTQANSSPVTDGHHVVAVFPTAGLVCLDVEGNVLWRHDLGALNAGAFTDPGIQWGFASSPILWNGSVILQVDVHDGPYLAAWNLATGERRWRVEREVAPSWATPTVVAGPEGDELIANGSTIHAYDPASGEELWSLGPNSELVIATPIVGDGVAFVSAGYPPIKPIYAVKSGARGAIDLSSGGVDERLAWSADRGGAYLPTPLLYRGLLYIVHHNGRIVAYEARSGAAIYKERFSQGGTFTGSPVAVNGRLYVPTEEGLLYVLEAGTEYRESWPSTTSRSP
jgi:outer membrane protein assembly factor BamB